MNLVYLGEEQFPIYRIGDNCLIGGGLISGTHTITKIRFPLSCQFNMYRAVIDFYAFQAVNIIEYNSNVFSCV